MSSRRIFYCEACGDPMIDPTYLTGDGQLEVLVCTTCADNRRKTRETVDRPGKERL